MLDMPFTAVVKRGCMRISAAQVSLGREAMRPPFPHPQNGDNSTYCSSRRQ